jgi:hypothetical protein
MWRMLSKLGCGKTLIGAFKDAGSVTVVVVRFPAVSQTRM